MHGGRRRRLRARTRRRRRARADRRGQRDAENVPSLDIFEGENFMFLLKRRPVDEDGTARIDPGLS